MKGRRIKRTRIAKPIWICSLCFEIKELYSRGMCCTCYGIRHKADIQTQKEKVRKSMDETIAPVKLMGMKPEQIIRDWDNILKGAGF